MPRMRFKAVSPALPDIPPVQLTEPQQEAYRALLGQIRAYGLEQQIPLEPVIQAAKQKARIEWLESRLNVAMETDPAGKETASLLCECRKQSSCYLSLLGKIGLTGTARTHLANLGKSKGIGNGDQPDHDLLSRASASLDFDYDEEDLELR